MHFSFVESYHQSSSQAKGQLHKQNRVAVTSKFHTIHGVTEAAMHVTEVDSFEEFYLPDWLSSTALSTQCKWNKCKHTAYQVSTFLFYMTEDQCRWCITAFGRDLVHYMKRGNSLVREAGCYDRRNEELGLIQIEPSFCLLKQNRQTVT